MVTKSNWYHHTMYRYDSDSFTKLWRQETSYGRLVVIYSSALFNVHWRAHTISIAKWNGICSGDNTRVRGCLCICYVSYALSQRDITRYNFIQWNWSERSVKSRLNISHIFILFRSRIKSSSKMMLDRWGKGSTELLRQCNDVSEVIVHVWCVARLLLVQMFTIWI